MNAAGIGAFFNLMNFGQMYSYHVLLLPVLVVLIVSAHVLLVRRHGVVPPFELDEKLALARAGMVPEAGGGSAAAEPEGPAPGVDGDAQP
jgi:ubiquinol-cytochrome c reductase cytochrome b subunit